MTGPRKSTWPARGWLKVQVIGLSAGIPRVAGACSVCVGGSDSPHTHAMNNAILFLLAVTAGVLAAFAVFFIYLWRRSRMARTVACVDVDFLRLENDAGNDDGTQVIAG